MGRGEIVDHSQVNWPTPFCFIRQRQDIYCDCLFSLLAYFFTCLFFAFFPLLPVRSSRIRMKFGQYAFRALANTILFHSPKARYLLRLFIFFVSLFFYMSVFCFFPPFTRTFLSHKDEVRSVCLSGQRVSLWRAILVNSIGVSFYHERSY